MEAVYILEREAVEGENWVTVAYSNRILTLQEIRRKAQVPRHRETGERCKFRVKRASHVEILTGLELA